MRAEMFIIRVSYSHLLAEMRRSSVAVTVLIYVFLFIQKICGAEMEMKVRLGENITLYCDRLLTRGSSIVWIRNCSHEHQPSLIIDYQIMYREVIPRFSFVKNSNIYSFDLHITNITASDLGLYYCAEFERKVDNKSDIIYSSDVYYYGDRKIRLSLDVSSTTVSPPPVSDCFLCWTLLVSVCSVFVLFCFICVYCLCQKKTTDGRTDHQKMTNKNTFEVDDDEVCYASLDVTTRRPKRLKKKQPQSSDFSTYAPVRTDTVQNFN